MMKAIMAARLHFCLTNETPRHENCPRGVHSWCKYRAAQASGTHFDRPAALHPDVANNILTIYEGLSKKDVLERCLGGPHKMPPRGSIQRFGG